MQRKEIQFNPRALLFTFGCSVFLANCAARPAPEQVSFDPIAIEDEGCITNHPGYIGEGAYIDVTYSSQSSWRPNGFNILPLLDAQAYSISPSAVPDFAIAGGYAGGNTFGIVSEMLLAPECQIYTVITIRTDDAEEIEVQRVEDWSSVAGPEAVDALANLERECSEMRREVAVARFGDPGTRAPDGVVSATADSSDYCQAVAQSLTYGLQIHGPEGILFISNVFGDLYVRGEG
ncbi:MAG: hypothetical protein AAFX39_01035 [Pseudomonadota bacterium]